MNRRTFLLGLLAFAVVPSEALAGRKRGGRSRRKSTSRYKRKSPISTFKKKAKKAEKVKDTFKRVTRTGRVNRERINMRSMPSVTAPIIAKVSRNYYLRVTEERDGWGKVNYNGRDGWIYMPLLDFD